MGLTGRRTVNLGLSWVNVRNFRSLAKDVAERKGKVIARNLQTVSCEFVRTHFFWKQST